MPPAQAERIKAVQIQRPSEFCDHAPLGRWSVSRRFCPAGDLPDRLRNVFSPPLTAGNSVTGAAARAAAVAGGGTNIRCRCDLIALNNSRGFSCAEAAAQLSSAVAAYRINLDIFSLVAPAQQAKTENNSGQSTIS
jgi:hypothetical protein